MLDNFNDDGFIFLVNGDVKGQYFQYKMNYNTEIEKVRKRVRQAMTDFLTRRNAAEQTITSTCKECGVLNGGIVWICWNCMDDIPWD